MPNWCFNKLTVTGPDDERDRWFKFLEDDYPDHGLLGTFVQPKYPVDTEDWYWTHVDTWGTKWDVNEYYITGNQIDFETAWSPPIAWLKRMSVDFPKLRFDMYFEEEGMDFLGLAIVQNGACAISDRAFPNSDDRNWWLEDDMEVRAMKQQSWQDAVEEQQVAAENEAEREFRAMIADRDWPYENREEEIGIAYDRAE